MSMDWVKQLFSGRRRLRRHDVSEKLEMRSTINFFCQGDVLYKIARSYHISNVRN